LTERPDVPFAANNVRLTPREWVIALAIVVAIVAVVPAAWEWVEPLEVETNHRMPFRLGSDYWTYSRYCRTVCAEGDKDKTLVVGDSVVWGHYVGKDQTLPAHLNRILGAKRFVNLGIDGIHPAALAGLMEYYGRAISGRKVILHCNLLWMRSERRDLQSTKEFPINHPDLIPQFTPHIPSYKASRSHRLGVVIGRKLPFFDWANHVQIICFYNPKKGTWSDLPTWTIDNPRKNPFDALRRELPSPDDRPRPRPDARPWTSKRNIRKDNPPWVDLAGSFQWRCFRRTIDILIGRGNRVFVVVGPLNEYMLTEASLATYAERRAEVRTWLQEHRIPHYVPAALPSEMYADASHPLGEGYGLLAANLLKDKAFLRFLTDIEVAR